MSDEMNAKVQAMARAAREGRLTGGRGRPLMIDTRWLLALGEAFADGIEDPSAHWERMGLAWGRLWVRDLAQETRAYQASPQDLDLEDLIFLLTDELVRGGWGHITFDFDTFAEGGMILAEVRGGPSASGMGGVAEGAAAIVAGFIAGALGSVSELPMEGVGVVRLREGASVASVAVAHRDRTALVRRLLAEGRAFALALETAGAA